MTLLRLKRKLFVFRARYFTMFLILALVVMFFLPLKIGQILVWSVWTITPCGLTRLGGFFKTNWFLVPRNLFGLIMIIINV